MHTYRTLLSTCFAGLLGLALLASGVAWWGAEQSRWQLERTRLATEVLEDYLRLRSDVFSVFSRMADAVEHPSRVTDMREAEERARILEAVDRVRRGIGREVSFVGDSEDETEELTLLAEIEQGLLYVFGQFRQAKTLIRMGRPSEAEAMLDSALRDATGNGFRSKVDAAVQEEEEEVERAHATAAAALRLVSLLSKVSVGSVLLLGSAALVLLLRRLRAPLRELEAAARAVSAGDLGRRAMVGSSSDEFARVADSFNDMVAQVAENRAGLEAARRGLEAAVAARTAELAEANAALQRADGLRRRFLADISHELRTPLTVIRGEAEVTLRGRDRPAEEYRGALSRIAEQAAHTGRLVDDLLFLARNSAGVPRLQLRAVALAPLVRQVVDEVSGLAEAHRVGLHFAADPSQSPVEGDSGRLRQLVMILVDNAIRYSEPGGRVDVTMLPGPGGVVLRVLDAGVGIDPDELPHVFDRFFRGGQAKERNDGGSGLGLPLAKAIVESHGGRISIDSGVGRGTEVTVILPAVSPPRAVA